MQNQLQDALARRIGDLRSGGLAGDDVAGAAAAALDVLGPVERIRLAGSDPAETVEAAIAWRATVSTGGELVPSAGLQRDVDALVRVLAANALERLQAMARTTTMQTPGDPVWARLRPWLPMGDAWARRQQSHAVQAVELVAALGPATRRRLRVTTGSEERCLTLLGATAGVAVHFLPGDALAQPPRDREILRVELLRVVRIAAGRSGWRSVSRLHPEVGARMAVAIDLRQAARSLDAFAHGAPAPAGPRAVSCDEGRRRLVLTRDDRWLPWTLAVGVAVPNAGGWRVETAWPISSAEAEALTLLMAALAEIPESSLTPTAAAFLRRAIGRAIEDVAAGRAWPHEPLAGLVHVLAGERWDPASGEAPALVLERVLDAWWQDPELLRPLTSPGARGRLTGGRQLRELQGQPAALVGAAEQSVMGCRLRGRWRDAERLQALRREGIAAVEVRVDGRTHVVPASAARYAPPAAPLLVSEARQARDEAARRWLRSAAGPVMNVLIADRWLPLPPAPSHAVDEAERLLARGGRRMTAGAPAWLTLLAGGLEPAGEIVSGQIRMEARTGAGSHVVGVWILPYVDGFPPEPGGGEPPAEIAVALVAGEGASPGMFAHLVRETEPEDRRGEPAGDAEPAALAVGGWIVPPVSEGERGRRRAGRLARAGLTAAAIAALCLLIVRVLRG